MTPSRESSAERFSMSKFIVALGMFLLGLLVQGSLYAATVREDIHDLKRDMADVKCTVAVYTHAPLLPVDCIPGRTSENGTQWKPQ